MARAPSSGRIPIVGLTDAQRAEIARGHAEGEKAYSLAIRLNLTTAMVKGEIKRLRREAGGGRARERLVAFAAIAKVLAPALVGALAFSAAVGYRTSRPPKAESVRPEPEQDVLRKIYEKIDGRSITLEEVLPLLESDDEATRLAGVRGYTQVAQPLSDAAALLPLLLDESRRVRLAALQAAGVRGDSRAIDSLAAVLHSARDPGERGMAIVALARTADDAAVMPIVLALADESPSIRHGAFEALARRLGTKLECQDRLDKEPEVVRDVFKNYWEQRRRAP